MALDDHRPHYADPQLWLRLGPRISEHYTEQAEYAVARKATSYDSHCYTMGYLEALRWVLKEARDLNKGDEE